MPGNELFPRRKLSPPRTRLLQSARHTAVHALEVFPPGTADSALFAHAQQQDTIFITTDKDFFHTVPLTFAQHHGAMVITLRRPNRDGLLRRLADALAALGTKNLENTVWLITDARIYSRQKTRTDGT